MPILNRRFVTTIPSSVGMATSFDGPSLTITAFTLTGNMRDAVTNNGLVEKVAGETIKDVTFTFAWNEQIKGFAGFLSSFTTDAASVNEAGGSFTPLTPTSGTGFTFTSTLSFAEDSIGSVTVSVLAGSVEAVDDPPSRFGPQNTVSLTINYSNPTDAVIPEVGELIKPDVRTSTPSTQVYPNTTYDVTFEWTEDILETSFDLADINATNGTLSNLQRVEDRVDLYSATLTLSGSGSTTLTITQDTVTDLNANTGPPADRSVTFAYNTALGAAATTVTGADTTIYDSGAQAFNSTQHLLGLTGDETSDLGQPSGGGHKGVSDLVKIGDDLYGVAQIQRISDSTTLDVNNQARGILFRIGTSSGSIPTALKKYRGITEAAKSITERSDDIYFFEGSQYADYFSIPRSTNDWRGRVGFIRSVSQTSTSIIDRGLNWRSKINDPDAAVTYDNTVYGIHRATSAPMQVIDDDLYVYTGYGNTRFINSVNVVNSQVSEEQAEPVTYIDNWQLIRLGKELLFNLNLLDTNDRTGFELIQTLVELSLCYVGFTPEGKLFITPKFARESVAAGSSGLGETDTMLTDSDRSRDFLSSGTLLIEQELITYSGITDTMFTGLTRGAFNTNPASHSCGARVYFVDHVIDMTDNYLARPINELRLRSDSDQLYNQIRIHYANNEREYFTQNRVSVDTNKAREREFTLALDRHQGEWVRWLAQKYLDQYGTLKYICDLELKPSFYLKVGEIIAIKEPERSGLTTFRLFQIIRVTQNPSQMTTTVQLRSV